MKTKYQYVAKLPKTLPPGAVFRIMVIGATRVDLRVESQVFSIDALKLVDLWQNKISFCYSCVTCCGSYNGEALYLPLFFY